MPKKKVEVFLNVETIEELKKVSSSRSEAIRICVEHYINYIDDREE